MWEHIIYIYFTFVLQCIMYCLASHKIVTYHIFDIFQRNNNTFRTPGLPCFGINNFLIF